MWNNTLPLLSAMMSWVMSPEKDLPNFVRSSWILSGQKKAAQEHIFCNKCLLQLWQDLCLWPECQILFLFAVNMDTGILDVNK